jgi:hypothetical protein
MRPMGNETFQEYFCHDFTKAIILGFQEEMEKKGTEPMRMSVGIS